jgi:hypothetical protein
VRTALVLVLVAACWSSPSTPPSEPPHRAPVAQPLEAAPVPAHSVWIGRYTCRQGITAIQLTVDVSPGGDAGAIFDFGPHPGNPELPAGSFRLTGTVRTIGSELALELIPDRWIHQPDGYVMVGFHAETDRARRWLRGAITDPSCETLELRRTD